MSELEVHIVEFCAAVDRQHHAQEERLKGDPENPAHDQLDLKPRARDALIDFIATRVCVDIAVADQFVHRCGHGAFWGPWRRTSQNWPDFTATASIICAYFTADRVSELQQRFCAEYPDEAREMGMLPRDPAVRVDQPAPTHSPDFTSVDWFGVRYTFAKGNQAQSIRVLWDAWASGGHSVSQERIGELINSRADPFQLAKVLRRRRREGGYEQHPAWGTMIQPDAKGCFRLVPPRSG